MPFALKSCLCGAGENTDDHSTEHPKPVSLENSNAKKPNADSAKVNGIDHPQPESTASVTSVNAVGKDDSSGARSSAKSDLWDQAYKKLKTNNSEPVEKYEQILAPDNKFFTSEQDVQSAIQKQLKDREAKQWALSIGSHSIKVRKCGESVVRFLVWSKDVVSAAVSTQPYAAIAMAGVSVMLPLFTQASVVTDDLMAGLEEICSLVRLYNLREKLYLGKSATEKFEEALVKLYSDILLYQISTTIHLSHNQAVRAGLNILRPTEWEDQRAKIKKSDEACNRLADFIDKDLEKRFQDEQEAKLEKSVELQAAMLSIVGNVQNVLEQQLDEQIRNRRDKLLGGFAFNYRSNKDFVPRRVPGTCVWFLEDKTFLKWRSAPQSSMLVLSAGPGCGKSVLAKYLVDDRGVTPSILSSMVCYTFFKQNQLSATDTLRAIIHQILTTNPETDVVASALDTWSKFGESLVSNQFELWNLFTVILQKTSNNPVVVVLDALDECPQDSRNWLIGRFLDLIEEKNKNPTSGTRLKILATTRPYVHVASGRVDAQRNIYHVDQEGTEQSKRMLTEINLVIENWVHTELGQSLKPADQDAIIKKMQTMQSRTYLWVSLAFKLIKEKSEIKKTAKKLEPYLDAVPSGVDDAYNTLLQDCPDVGLAQKLFALVLVAERTLTITELSVACESLDSDASAYADLDLGTDQQFHDIIASACRSMLTVIDGRVFFLHQTVAEYLLNSSDHGISNGTHEHSAHIWHHAVIKAEAHSMMAKSCMKMLLLSDFHQLQLHYFDNKSMKLSKDCQARYGAMWQNKSLMDQAERPQQRIQVPLYVYAAEHWAEHYKRATSDARQALLLLALALCDARHPTVQNWWDARHPSDGRTTPLIVACSLDLLEVAKKTLSPFESAIDCRDGEGDCDLAWESLPEHRKVNSTSVGLLGTALITASLFGYTPTVKELLDRAADPNLQHGWGQTTAFATACEAGHLETAQLLYSRGADPLTPEAIAWSRRSALAMACVSNRKAVAQWLIELDLSKHKTDGIYADALGYAVEFCGADCIELLADPARTGLKPSDYNDQGLGVLSRSNHIMSDELRTLGIVKTLIEKGGADPNARPATYEYGSFLNWVCHVGLVPVLEYLLSRNTRTDHTNTDALGTKIEPEDALQVSLLSNSKNGPAIRAALIKHANSDIVTKIDGKGNNRLHLMGKHLYDHNYFVGQRGFHFQVLESQQIKACYWLVENGVNVNALNHDGKTPGDIFNSWTARLGILNQQNSLKKELQEFFKKTGANSGKVLAPGKWANKPDQKPADDTPHLVHAW